MPTNSQSQANATGLIKRGLRTAATAFDETQSTATRVRAAGTIAVAVGGPVAGGILGIDIVNNVDPGLWTALSPYTETMWITGAAAGGIALVTSGVGAIKVRGAKRDSWNHNATTEVREDMRSTFNKAKTWALLGTGVAGVIAAGLSGGDAAHLGGLHQGAQLMQDVTLAYGVTTVIAQIGQRAWSNGLPPVPRARPTVGE